MASNCGARASWWIWWERTWAHWGYRRRASSLSGAAYRWRDAEFLGYDLCCVAECEYRVLSASFSAIAIDFARAASFSRIPADVAAAVANVTSSASTATTAAAATWISACDAQWTWIESRFPNDEWTGCAVWWE